MQNRKAIEEACYKLADLLRREAEYACEQRDVHKVHFFVSEGMKMGRMAYNLGRRYPDAD